MKKLLVYGLILSILFLAGCSNDFYETESSSSYEQTSNYLPITTEETEAETTDESVFDGCVKYNEARNHVGQTITVYGDVVSTYFAGNSNGQPTFLNIGAPNGDNSRCTLVIWCEDLRNFEGSPDITYRWKTIKATGYVRIYNGAAQITVTSPSQIEIVE